VEESVPTICRPFSSTEAAANAIVARQPPEELQQLSYSLRSQ